MTRLLQIDDAIIKTEAISQLTLVTQISHNCHACETWHEQDTPNLYDLMVNLMAGTASEFYDHKEEVSHDSYSADTLSTWLFGSIHASCSLDDINHCGCSILIPRDETVIPASFSLLIMSYEDEQKLQSVISGQQRWIDEDFSATHKKMGVQFTGIDDEQRSEIDDIARFLRLPGQNRIKCGLLRK